MTRFVTHCLVRGYVVQIWATGTAQRNLTLLEQASLRDAYQAFLRFSPPPTAVSVETALEWRIGSHRISVGDLIFVAKSDADLQYARVEGLLHHSFGKEAR